MTPVESTVSKGLSPWAQLTGWVTIVGSGVAWPVQWRLGVAAGHRQPFLILIGFVCLLVAHAWVLAVSVWLVRRWRARMVLPLADKVLYWLVVLEVAYPYLMDFVRYGI